MQLQVTSDDAKQICILRKTFKIKTAKNEKKKTYFLQTSQVRISMKNFIHGDTAVERKTIAVL